MRVLCENGDQLRWYSLPFYTPFLTTLAETAVHAIQRHVCMQHVQAL